MTPDNRGGLGAIMTMGEHKGSGLALMCELLAGALTGSGATGPDYTRIYNGMLSIYMSVERFGTGDTYAEEIKRYIAYFKSSNPVVSGGEVLVPGEPELRSRQSKLNDGLTLPPDVWAAIVTAGKNVGVEPPV